MMQVALVALGGAAGSVLRYGVQKTLNASFPYGTLAVNILGCFLIGILWATIGRDADEQKRLLLMTGLCGGFTTFSSFTLEGVDMLMNERWGFFLFYIIVSVAGGMLATFLGYKLFN